MVSCQGYGLGLKCTRINLFNLIVLNYSLTFQIVPTNFDPGCCSAWPPRRQPTTLPCPWDSPGKNRSGLPFPSPMHESEKWKGSHSSRVWLFATPGLQLTRPLRPWDFPGKSIGGGSKSQVSNTWILLRAPSFTIFWLQYPRSRYNQLKKKDIINKGWKLNPFLSTCSTVWWRMHLAYGWNKANNKLLVLSLLVVGAGVVAVWCWSGGCIVLEQLWGDSSCPRAKGKPQQDGRRGNIMFRIKPHIHQRRSEGSNKPCVHQDPVLSQRLR